MRPLNVVAVDEASAKSNVVSPAMATPKAVVPMKPLAGVGVTRTS